MLRSVIVAVVVLAVAYLAFGKNDANDRPAQSVAIAKINGNPSDYYGRRLGVAGRVVAASGIFGTGAFWLRDASNAELLILTRNGVPPAGTDVTVRGELKQALVIGQRQVLIMDNPDVSTR